MPGTGALESLPVRHLDGVGPSLSVKLAGLGIETVQDVLFHLPFRYQDRTRLTPVGALLTGHEALVAGEVVLADVLQGKRRTLLVRVADGTGSLNLRFFHFNRAQQRQFERGRRVICFGEIRRGYGLPEMVHPEYRVQTGADDVIPIESALTPFYPATEGVQQATLRKLSEQALDQLGRHPPTDWLAGTALETLDLPDLTHALRLVHRPPPDEDVEALLAGRHPAHRRLALEELVAHRLGLRRLRASARRDRAPVIDAGGRLAERLLDSLHFGLTAAQVRVRGEVDRDLASSEPMLRLVQGDVGSGKTVVAALAAAQTVESGLQVALMAPTEILAEQHLLTLSAWFEPLGVSIGWLSGKLGARQRRAAIESIAMGREQIVVGTHALFQETVAFARLGLAIIDEQHRFGVHQRMALRDKGAGGHLLPHQLIMTATPIPRTLAMTAYADLDVSIIDELPPGRQSVTTVAVDSARRAEVIERVNVAIERGRQVYWVCTLVEESESLQAEAAEATLESLRAAMPGHGVGLVHGRMKARDKEAIMQAFKARELDLLVATTVIEVGVDVPNASLMIIENAERLGLSQLHQLRGRVGRGEVQSSCILMYQAPLSNNARERIAILRESTDGFRIAEKDLELRGAGEVLGTRQTGLAEFRIADLTRDGDLLDAVGAIADPLLENRPAAVDALIARWIGTGRQVYGTV